MKKLILGLLFLGSCSVLDDIHDISFTSPSADYQTTAGSDLKIAIESPSSGVIALLWIEDSSGDSMYTTSITENNDYSVDITLDDYTVGNYTIYAAYTLNDKIYEGSTAFSVVEESDDADDEDSA